VSVRILQGDCRAVLRTLPDESVHCVVTSPPYFGLRDYGVAGQIGLEPTPDEFVDALVDVFREVRRVLRADGTVWLNLGDSYNAYNGGAGPSSSLSKGAQTEARPKLESGYGLRFKGLKPKDLIGIPWRVAFALQADGWYLRQDIIWAKPNPMPESVRDRCTKSHEYLFLLAKSERYYYDAEAISEPVTDTTIERVSQPTLRDQAGSDRVPGKTNGPMKAVVRKDQTGHNGRAIQSGFASQASHGGIIKRSGNKARKDATERGCPESGVAGSVPWEGTTRNKRSVWIVTTKPFSGAHFATFPPDLIEPCVLAGCPAGGTVLDPFGGAGTTGLVADRHGRNAVLIELNPAYAEMARKRITGDSPLFAEVA
jgi:DNA modification methylase